MQLQNTLRNEIRLMGIEPYGGNLVMITIKPAEEDVGILFQTPNGDIQAKLNYASESRSSILLDNGRTQVINVEHILATLYAYGIDNALIELKRMKSKSFELLEGFGLATKVEVVPVFGQRERTLCDRIEEVGLEQQTRERSLLGIAQPAFKNKLYFSPIARGLVITATTNYKIPGKQEFTAEITPQTYKDRLSKSRPYAKHVPVWMSTKLASAIASLANPSFGIGHGYENTNVFLPVRTANEWYQQEIYPAEIARHTIVDRLGALALLDGRLEGVRVIARFSGHANDLIILREMTSDKMFIPQY